MAEADSHARHAAPFNKAQGGTQDSPGKSAARDTPGNTLNVSAEEIARFDALADQWWNPAGPMRPLHMMNPARIGWIAARLPAPAATGATATGAAAGEPLSILDIGCGAGLAAEALARLGHRVLGVDAAAEAIGAARDHAALTPGLDLRYRAGTAEALRDEGLRFRAITALEVIEHVPDPDAFLRLLHDLLEPGGRVFLSTLNRTMRAWAVAKLGAEYLLRWLPVGTHDWQHFLPPADLAARLRRAGLSPAESAGLSFNPLHGRWAVSRDLSVNYMIAANRIR